MLPKGTDLEARARERDGFEPCAQWEGAREGKLYKAGVHGGKRVHLRLQSGLLSAILDVKLTGCSAVAVTVGAMVRVLRGLRLEAFTSCAPITNLNLRLRPPPIRFPSGLLQQLLPRPVHEDDGWAC